MVCFLIQVVILLAFFSSHSTKSRVFSLGSMSSIAVSYGENGPVFCALSSDGSHSVSCVGADNSIVYGAPSRLPLYGLTAGDSFVCGLLLDSKQPYCWGSNFYVKMGIPQPMEEGAAYSSISAGDHHLCGLRIPTEESHEGTSVIDCWGYNMTSSHEFGARISSITAGSVFNCGLFEHNLSAFCFGDETGSNVISLIPRGLSFQAISAGGFMFVGSWRVFRCFVGGGVWG